MKPSTSVLIVAINDKRRLRFQCSGKRRLVEPQCYGSAGEGTELLQVRQLEGAACSSRCST